MKITDLTAPKEYEEVKVGDIVKLKLVFSDGKESLPFWRMITYDPDAKSGSYGLIDLNGIVKRRGKESIADLLESFELIMIADAEIILKS